MKAQMLILAFSYMRFSSPQQAKGTSISRQTKDALAWCARNTATLDKRTTFVDAGISAFQGKHRMNPDRHALASFLALVGTPAVPRGSYLIVESLDRLTREEMIPALTLLLQLINAGIRIVQLRPEEVIYDEQSDPQMIMGAIGELRRGRSESKMKSVRVKGAWEDKVERARNGVTMTATLPAWIESVDDERRVIPERAAVIKQIFTLAAAGYGVQRIIQKLIDDDVKPFGKRWTRAYVHSLFKDRRALGEFQPRQSRGKKTAGEPFNYYPPVIDANLYERALMARRSQLRQKGRQGKHLDLFPGKLLNARDGEPYWLATRSVGKGKRPQRELFASSSTQGHAPAHQFPAEIFEQALLRKIREVNVSELLGHAQADDKLEILKAERDRLEFDLDGMEKSIQRGGFSERIDRLLREAEGRLASVKQRLAEAEQEAAYPASVVWKDTQTLAAALETAEDKEDTRLRLRSGLLRVVEAVFILVVPTGTNRIAAVQLFFQDTKDSRYFLIPYKRASRVKSWQWDVLSRATADGAPRIDLRNPDDVKAVERELAGVSVDELLKEAAG